MRVFVTGATGWVGSHVVRELIGAGHSVLGLSRSEEKAPALQAAGADVLLGTLDDHARLQDAVRQVDAVAHLAFNHDFSRFAENGAQEARAVEAMAEALRGSDTPFLITSGVAMVAPGRVARETDHPEPNPGLPRQSDALAHRLAGEGLHTAAVRLSPSTHGVGETHGFVPMLMDLARRTGVSAYIGDGANRWPAVHVADAARLYRLALESGVTEQVYHAVDEEGVAFRDVAAVIGERLGLPVESRGPEHFGWFSMFAGLDMPASSGRTQAALSWTPTGPRLLEDIARPDYYPA